ncbi:MAG: M42 family metallopeptidase [Bacteroidetes bacterium]|nr:M42 family metallopeptidase [Bacteroidota bacterium]
MIKKLTLASGLPGFEQDITKILQDELKGSPGSFSVDRIGNALWTFENTTGDSHSSSSDMPKILLAAHQDEIGFIVSEILSAGFIRIHNLGSWNPVTLPSSPVEITNWQGNKIPGIIGNISPHFLKDRKSDIPEIQDLFIDIGAASRLEVVENFGIRIGDAVTPVTSYSYNEVSRCMMSKAFDDRIGAAALVELGLRLSDKKGCGRENTTVLAATVQEEVGTRGASVLANYIDADIAIIVEGAPADDLPGSPVNPQTRVRGGAHVRIFDPTMIADRELLNYIREIVGEKGLLIQETVRKGGGTDGRELHLASRGIPSIVTGVPVRYAHSHNCLISIDDFYQLVDLLEAVCMGFDRKTRDQISKH